MKAPWGELWDECPWDEYTMNIYPQDETPGDERPCDETTQNPLLPEMSPIFEWVVGAAPRRVIHFCNFLSTYYSHLRD